MKLAEALIIRADYQKRIEQLGHRLHNSAKVQEGELPPENPNDLLSELYQLFDQLERIVQQINRTNASCRFNETMTLSDALTKRDVLGSKRNELADLIKAATVKHDRYSRSEVKICSTVNIAQLQKQVDELSKQYRELDASIQQFNWLTELQEA
ncbi:DIP1984 family protein [Brevibacillus fortis]|uniref:Septicolysin n=1 Tax=Brevibacillus fortis TaxID=2126352 RepID=A0A2P7V7Y7_9BACL|nr:DIP1984 family protein [Brevibacillus fortis]PSJ95327.1 hypothetical protein C7R93_12945 [Brevibacillus fortis]